MLIVTTMLLLWKFSFFHKLSWEYFFQNLMCQTRPRLQFSHLVQFFMQPQRWVLQLCPIPYHDLQLSDVSQ
ncbi:hypothetical protein PRUPE_1G000900 [Prunus persica]|uniref:Uncharacterized protein n=1 Tax=Prunus persica TaxID=3760 RepID=A0A251QTK4_PRUPE|nr:hypothetical protein PRUPE_1G000900 [Prunus persica]